MLAALIKALGVVSNACKTAKIDRTTHYRWMKSDKNYARQVKDIENIAIDFAETALHKKIRKGDTIATIFYLKTKGKERGYVERQENRNVDREGNDIPPSPAITVVRAKNDDDFEIKENEG